MTALQDPEQYKTGSDLEIKISANKDASTLVIEYVCGVRTAGYNPANSPCLVHHSNSKKSHFASLVALISGTLASG